MSKPSGLQRKRPRSSWEADPRSQEIVEREHFSFADILNIEGDPWVDDVRALVGMPPTIDPGPGRERVLPDSTVEKPTKVVWKICDANPTLSRAQHIELCVQAGINVHTARTQQSKWAVARKSK